MKTLLALLLLIPSLSWGEVILSNPFEGSDDLNNKRILCELAYSNLYQQERFNPNAIEKFIDKNVYDDFDIFKDNYYLKKKDGHYIYAPDWNIFLFGFEFMKDNNVVVYDIYSTGTTDKIEIWPQYSYFQPKYKKTFAYYYADEENITIQTRDENKQFLFLSQINRYTLKVFKGPSSGFPVNCKVVEQSIGKQFNEIKIKTEKYFQDIEAEREKIKYRDRKI